jgi:hypothetical protein
VYLFIAALVLGGGGLTILLSARNKAVAQDTK